MGVEIKRRNESIREEGRRQKRDINPSQRLSSPGMAIGIAGGGTVLPFITSGDIR